MIGDKLIITEYHRQGAMKAMEVIQPRLLAGERLGVTVAGESGSGKSEIGYCLAGLAEGMGKRAIVLGQDDYFMLPPKSNHKRRLDGIDWVGTREVRLDLLDLHMAVLKDGPGEDLEKPLIYFDEDRIGKEIIKPGKLDMVIAEGTYTTLLKNVDVRVFIDRNYRQTKKNRLRRDRDPLTPFVEKVLALEHKIISGHRRLADVILEAPPEERGRTKTRNYPLGDNAAT
jgi:uridine kinase